MTRRLYRILAAIEAREPVFAQEFIDSGALSEIMQLEEWGLVKRSQTIPHGRYLYVTTREGRQELRCWHAVRLVEQASRRGVLATAWRWLWGRA